MPQNWENMQRTESFTGEIVHWGIGNSLVFRGFQDPLYTVAQGIVCHRHGEASPRSLFEEELLQVASSSQVLQGLPQRPC